MVDCSKAQTMLDFILWTQTESEPIDAADTLGYSVCLSSSSPLVTLLSTLSRLSSTGNSYCSETPILDQALQRDVQWKVGMLLRARRVDVIGYCLLPLRSCAGLQLRALLAERYCLQ